MGSEVIGHPEPRTKHFAFDLVLDHERSIPLLHSHRSYHALFSQEKEIQSQRLADIGSHRQSWARVPFSKRSVPILSSAKDTREPRRSGVYLQLCFLCECR